MSARLPRIPRHAVVFLTEGSGVIAERIRRKLSRKWGLKQTCHLSILWGSEGWRTYAKGMAILSERPFVELRKGG